MSLDHPMRRILLVDDDDEMSCEIVDYLKDHGFQVEHRATGSTGLAAARTEPFDLLVVDRMLPELDGLSLIQDIRDKGCSTPVLILSALGAVDERVRGLKLGGDDYLVKPFAFVELAARIEALLRRPADVQENRLKVGPFHVDLLARTVHRDGAEIALQPREFRLFTFMARRPGLLLTREMLLEEVWSYRFAPQSNLIDVHVSKLRRKLERPGEPPFISNVRGVGFRFDVLA